MTYQLRHLLTLVLCLTFVTVYSQEHQEHEGEEHGTRSEIRYKTSLDNFSSTDREGGDGWTLDVPQEGDFYSTTATINADDSLEGAWSNPEPVEIELSVLELITVLIFIAFAFLYINIHWIKLPSTIGLMILAISMSAIILLVGLVYEPLKDTVIAVMTDFDFNEVLFDIMLSFLLFAGALEINLKKLAEEKWVVLILATCGVLISTFVVGYAMYYVFGFLGLEVPLIMCLLFGALISPTDPIAVLALIKKMGVSKNLEIKIAGESLFNDGIGVVVFLTILSVAGYGDHGSGGEVTAFSVAMTFLTEVGGGVFLGALAGVVGFQLLKLIDNAHVELEVLLTLSLVMVGTQMAQYFGFSAPLAMVVLGIFLGNKGRSKALSEVTGEYVYKFWTLVDESLNAILFILIGFQMIIISTKFNLDFLIAALIAILVVLSARAIGVGIPIAAMSPFKKFERNIVGILTWGGLRGGISVALALSLPAVTVGTTDVTGLIVTCTYTVVVFSILVQGLTVQKLVEKSVGAPPKPDTTEIPGAI